MDGGSGLVQFSGPLGVLDGTERWHLTFYPLPEGKSYEDMRNAEIPQFLQAAGRADKMTLDIRKPGGQQWGVTEVRYVIGHHHEGRPPLDVAIELPNGAEMVSAPEVFEAEEAAEIFYAYYKTGDIPPGYALRPVEGYTADGWRDLREVTA
jgi:hypothetical protein